MGNKHNVLFVVVACVLIGWFQEIALADIKTGARTGDDHSTMNQGSMPGMSHEGHGAPATVVAHPGVVIRESKPQGLSFVYRLYSWDERNVMMKGMEGHVMPGIDASGKATNHLVVFIKDTDGKELAGGKVGFIVIGPDKAEQKTLTMSMNGGYGADVALKAPGTYTIRTKAVFGDRSVVEDFGHTVK